MTHWTQTVSELAGYCSLSCWLCALVPQVVKIHHDASVVGLSLGFLACQFAGDFLNFASCLRNRALVFQVLLSAYYCCIDIVLAGQYYFYSHMYSNPLSRWYRRPAHITSPKSSLRDNLASHEMARRNSTASRRLSIPQLLHAGGSALMSSSIVGSLTKVQAAPLLLRGRDGDPVNWGHVMAWLCAALYLFSRVPQLYANHKLQSTHGISMKFVTFAFLGNVLYSTSILLSHDALAGGETGRLFWQDQLSYFVGSVGTLFFDTVLISQWVYFRRLKHIKGLDLAHHHHHHHHHGHQSLPLAHHSRSSSGDRSSTAIQMSSRNSKRLSLTRFTPLSPIDFLEQTDYGTFSRSSAATPEKSSTTLVSASASPDEPFVFTQ